MCNGYGKLLSIYFYIASLTENKRISHYRKQSNHKTIKLSLYFGIKNMLCVDSVNSCAL